MSRVHQKISRQYKLLNGRHTNLGSAVTVQEEKASSLPWPDDVHLLKPAACQQQEPLSRPSQQT
jgi:hypothetical protein